MSIAPVLGCLSPSAMQLSFKIGLYALVLCSLIALALLVLGWQEHSFKWLPLYGTLLLLHPAWTTSLKMGDCGYGRRFFSVAVTAVFVAILLCQLFKLHVRIRHFLFVMCVLCWVGWGFGQFWWQHGGFWMYSDVLRRFEESVAFQTYSISCSRLFLPAFVLTLILCALHLRERFARQRVAV